jgi:hypothetical protein
LFSSNFIVDENICCRHLSQGIAVAAYISLLLQDLFDVMIRRARLIF